MKGFTPPRVHLQSRMLSGFGLRTSEGDGEAEELPKVDVKSETPASRKTEEATEKAKVEKGEVTKKRRSTLPNKALIKARPNVNKIVLSMKKKYNNHMKAKEKLERDFSANSSRAPQLSRRTTVAKYLNQRFGRDKWIPANEEAASSR